MSEVITNPKFSQENFITEKMSDFWNRVSNKRGMEIILNIYIELNSILLRKLYQINSEMSIQDIVPFNIRSGMIISLDRRQSIYTRIEIPSDNDEYIKSIPRFYSNLQYPKIEYLEGEDYEVVREDGTSYIDFSEGNPEVLRTEETGTDQNPYIYFPVVYTEDQRIYKNYGEAVGLEPETVEGVEGVEDEFYRNGVQALWKAMYTGPTISSIRQAMYVLHGLPFNQEAGIVEEIERVGLLEDGGPSITVNAGIGRDSFKLQLREEDVVSIDDSNVDTYVGFDVSDQNIRTFEELHQVNVIDENMLDDEDVSYETLDLSSCYYDVANDLFFIEESQIQGGRNVLADGGYFFDDNYNVLRYDPNLEGTISISEDLSDKWVRAFYNYRKRGDRRKYDLPDSLTIHEDIEEGDFLDKFTLFSSQLEIQDYAADGGTRGETAGKRTWIQNMFPFGQFSVRSGQELDVPTVVEDVEEFLDFLKPVYSDYTFQLQINPTNAHVFGRIFPDEILIAMVEQTDQSVINLGDIGRLTNSIYNSITFIGDQQDQSGFDPLPMWDQEEYFDDLLESINAGEREFEDSFYNTDAMTEDSHIQYMDNKGFYDDFQFWDRGVIAAETQSEAQNLANDLDGVTWQEIYYPPEHDEGQLIVDQSRLIRWDFGHVSGDQIVAWDDKSIKFDEGVDPSDSDVGLPDYDGSQVTWYWGQHSVDGVVANRTPFTYIFDGEEEAPELGPVLQGLWDDMNTFYDLRDIFLSR